MCCLFMFVFMLFLFCFRICVVSCVCPTECRHRPIARLMSHAHHHHRHTSHTLLTETQRHTRITLAPIQPISHQHRHWPTQLKPSSEHRRGGAPPARPPPPQAAPASYYNHPYSPNASHPNVETKPPRHTSTPTRPRQALPTADSNSFDSPPDMQSPPIPPRKQCSSNAVVAATAAAISAEISKLERNCWQDETTGNGSVRHSNTSSSSAMSSSSSGASFVTAASTFSHLNVSDPPVPTPRTKREVHLHQLRS